MRLMTMWGAWTQGRSLSGWVASLPSLILLLLVLLIGSGELLHGRLLEIGQALFGDRITQVQYYALRADPQPPSCNAQLDVDEEVDRLLAKQRLNVRSQDRLDDLIDAPPMDASTMRQSLQAALKQCLQMHARHEQIKAHITTEVKVFRAVEQALFDLFHFGANHRVIIALLLMGFAMLAATLSHGHLSLAVPHHRRDFLVQSLANAVAAAMLLWSCVRYFQISSNAGVNLEQPELHYIWIGLFALVLALSVGHLIKYLRPVPDRTDGTWGRALQTIPLGSIITLLAGSYYALHDHPSGLAIYLHSLAAIPYLPLHLALFIWCGMLFKQTRVIDLFMNLLRPWRLSPELMTYIILLAAAIPTAYTGGSGAFVMAAGAVVFHELRALGASSQYALGATAMAGSLGVVLSPSLIVVAIVAVNTEVTSAELFDWGKWVLLLTSTLFYLASRWRAPARPMQQRPAFWQAAQGMWPHLSPALALVALVMAVMGMYDVVLNAPLDENTAPLIMPVMFIAIVLFDQLLRSQGIGGDSTELAQRLNRQSSFNGAVRVATSETVAMMGGYVYLILVSQALGGVIERSEIMNLVPTHVDNRLVIMGCMTLAMVLIGMLMEPLGAIFLVSSSLAPLAYASGIAPVHFWITVLVAFELGYLTPPVAINQLLARQALGEQVTRDAMLDNPLALSGQSFYRRHERWLLPCGVMGVALLLVAFGPLLWRF
jgi:TRAP-type C4-dicarboxylate transport system permease large subunit